jgi:hypothetical protein
MRMNYKTYPTDYVQELKYSRGEKGRKKARAFMEYWDDMEHGEHNAIRFYAKSWDVSSSTSHGWIEEFDKEIDLFLAHWSLRNKQHYTYAKNSTEHLANKTNSYKAQYIGVCEDEAEQQPNKALNSYDEEKKRGWVFDKKFNDLFFIYARNGSFAGKKEEAYEEFIRVDIDIDLLKLSAVKYLRDTNIKNKYNLANFLKNEMYIKYMPKRIKLTLDGVQRVGVYDDDTKLFRSESDSFVGQMSPVRLVQLFEAGALEFLKY